MSDIETKLLTQIFNPNPVKAGVRVYAVKAFERTYDVKDLPKTGLTIAYGDSEDLCTYVMPMEPEKAQAMAAEFTAK
jgi:hypothetical protein